MYIYIYVLQNVGKVEAIYSNETVVGGSLFYDHPKGWKI